MGSNIVSHHASLQADLGACGTGRCRDSQDFDMLEADDECKAGSECAMNALQLKGQLTDEQLDEATAEFQELLEDESDEDEDPFLELLEDESDEDEDWHFDPCVAKIKAAEPCPEHLVKILKGNDIAAKMTACTKVCVNGLAHGGRACNKPRLLK